MTVHNSAISRLPKCSTQNAITLHEDAKESHLLKVTVRVLVSVSTMTRLGRHSVSRSSVHQELIVSGHITSEVSAFPPSRKCTSHSGNIS